MARTLASCRSRRRSGAVDRRRRRIRRGHDRQSRARPRARCSSRSRATSSTATTSCATRTRRAPRARSSRGSRTCRCRRSRCAIRGARSARSRAPGARASRYPVVAVTGSSGKTTVKELVAPILGAEPVAFCVTQGNLNNHIGVPLTLLRLGEDNDALVVEMGANHAGEIAYLASSRSRPSASSRTRAPRTSRASARSRASRRAKGELLEHSAEGGHRGAERGRPLRAPNGSRAARASSR